MNLEDAVMNMYATQDELQLLLRFFGDYKDPMNEDEVLNTLIGIIELNKMRCLILEDEYNKKFELNEYCKDVNALKLRQQFFGRMDDVEDDEEDDEEDDCEIDNIFRNFDPKGSKK